VAPYLSRIRRLRAMPLLETRGLCHQRLRCCDFSVDGGSVVAVTGASGAGKTQLLRALADLDPAAGEVFLDGMARRSIAAPLWRRQVAYVPATPAWWADTVREHFEPEQIASAEALLRDFGLDSKALDWPVDRLSTGETQRIGLVRAVARSPRVMLLDEPTSGLDRASRERVEKFLQRLLREGLAILVVAHYGGRIVESADRRLVVGSGGAVTEQAP